MDEKKEVMNKEFFDNLFYCVRDAIYAAVNSALKDVINKTEITITKNGWYFEVKGKSAQ